MALVARMLTSRPHDTGFLMVSSVLIRCCSVRLISNVELWLNHDYSRGWKGNWLRAATCCLFSRRSRNPITYRRRSKTFRPGNRRAGVDRPCLDYHQPFQGGVLLDEDGIGRARCWVVGARSATWRCSTTGRVLEHFWKLSRRLFVRRPSSSTSELHWRARRRRGTSRASTSSH